MDKQGLRYNEGKLRFDLIHPIAEQGLAKVLTKGAEKYAERNWELGMSWTSVIASLKRHLNAIERGEDYDLESGLLHADHLQCNAHFLSAYYKIAPQYDDRIKKKQLKIGLDIDEVLCDWLGGWMEMKGIKERPTSWLFDRDIISTFDAMEKEGTLNDFMLNLKPLMKPEDIPFEPHCYITSRRVPNEISAKWLDMHNFPTAPVYTVKPGTSKVEVAKQSGIDVFVDDNYKNFVELNNNGILCYLYDQPHNHRYNVGYKRIYNLKELL